MRKTVFLPINVSVSVVTLEKQDHVSCSLGDSPEVSSVPFPLPFFFFFEGIINIVILLLNS